MLRRGYGEATARLPPDPQEWAGRVAVGEGPEAGLLGELTWAGAINRDSGNRPKSKAELSTTVTQILICARRGQGCIKLQCEASDERGGDSLSP